MSDEKDSKAGAEQVAGETKAAERRKLSRRKQLRPIRVRPSHPGDGEFDEVSGTIDAHREGFYFATESNVYRKGMRLFVTIPYSPYAKGSDGEYIGEVVRVEKRSDGKTGVAVHLLHSMNLKRQ